MFDSIHWHIYGFTGIVDEVTGFGIIGDILGDMQVTPDLIPKVAAIAYAALILITYFIGNISPSIILAKSKGIDIKKEGSGNAGTTNALRVMGTKAGVITLVIDILKGVLAVLLAEIVAGEECAMYCAVAVIVGHIWPIVFKFKGGKGVATTFGALMAINPILGLWALGIVAVVTFLSKRMSAGSIAGAICFPVICLFNEPEFIVHGTLLAIIVLIKHRANIVRLLEGEEPKLSFLDKDKKKADAEVPVGSEEEAPVGDAVVPEVSAAEAESAQEVPTETEPEIVDAEEPESETESEPVELVESETDADDAEAETEDAAPEVEDAQAGSAGSEQEIEPEVPTESEPEPVDAEEQESETEPEAEAAAEPEEAEEKPETSEAEETATEAYSEESEPAEVKQPEKAPKPVQKKPANNRPNTKKNGKKKKSYPNKYKNGGNNKNNSNKKSGNRKNGNRNGSKKKNGKKK